MTIAIAFSNASFVMIWRGRMPSSSRRMTALPDSYAKSSRRLSGAGADDEPGSDMPSASATDAIVLAVNMPAQLPSLGQALHSMPRRSSSDMRARGVGADGFEHAHDVERLALVLARQDRSAVEEHGRQVEPGRGHQHPGQALVATGERDQRVEALGVHDGLDGVGDDLAATRASARMPSWPIEMPSRDGDRVELDREAAGGAHALPSHRFASRSSGMLHGVTSFHDEHTPTCDLPQSSSVMPMARNMARAGRPLVAVGDLVAARLHRVAVVLGHRR